MASRLLESECVAMFVLAGVFVFAQTFARGQKGGGGGGDVTAQAPGQSATPASGQSSSGGPSSPSRASLSGITFSRADWQRIPELRLGEVRGTPSAPRQNAHQLRIAIKSPSFSSSIARPAAAHPLFLPNHTRRIKAGVRTGYSLLIDEYVDATLAAPVDRDALRICCPVYEETVVIVGGGPDNPTPRRCFHSPPGLLQICDRPAAVFTFQTR